MGKLRTKIFENCPESFESELENFLNEIEERVADIKRTMEITGLEDLYKLEDAATLISDLGDDLY